MPATTLTCENGRFRPHSAPSGTSSVALLIRGFGVRVPGGAPELTWHYAESQWSRDSRFGAMFAPCLLVSPDLVPGVLSTLAGLVYTTRLSDPGRPLRWRYAA